MFQHGEMISPLDEAAARDGPTGIGSFMLEARHDSARSGPVSILLHPSTVPVLDVFRSLSCLEDQYDLALLDRPERALASFARPEMVKAIVSDALLFAFALTRQRGRPLCHRPLASRHGSLDEYCLVALIGAARVPHSDLAFEVATALEVESTDLIISMAADLVRETDLALLNFEAPNIYDFRAVLGSGDLPEQDIANTSNNSGFRYNI